MGEHGEFVETDNGAEAHGEGGLQRQAWKCEKEEKAEEIEAEEGDGEGRNTDGPWFCCETLIRKRNEQMNYLRLASRLDSQAKMTMIYKSMASIVKSLESSLASVSPSWWT